MLMLLGVVGALYEVGIVAAQFFVKHTKPAEDSSPETGSDSTPP
jgi:sec-independent protein translocase protein TatC